MNWDDYYVRYQTFALSMEQSKLVALVASKSLEDFPVNLPPPWRESIVTAFRWLAAALGNALDDLKAQRTGERAGLEQTQAEATADDKPTAGAEKAEMPEAAKSQSSPDLPHFDLVWASVAVMTNSSNLGLALGQSHRPNFARLVLTQQLTMSFAHISAFMVDSVRAICYARPDVLKSDRKIDWKTIIEAGDWNSLLSRLIDDYVLTFGWDSIRKGVVMMRERLGLKLNVADEVLDRIDEAELLRNVVVHDAGRASSEYLKRSGRTDVNLGEQLLIEPTFVEAVSRELLLLGGGVLFAVSEAHFGKKRESISGVFRSYDKR